MKHKLEFEKVIDKLGSKYETVIRIAAIAKKIADSDVTEHVNTHEKVTTEALRLFLQDRAEQGGVQSGK